MGENNKDFMAEAIKEAYDGITNKHGGPFGSVVVKDGKIVGRGHNRVLFNNDPTCHGEVEAIRDACKNLGTYDLSGCELYTTAEPCPMCKGAILWSNIDHIYYGCTINDTDKIGFRDEIFYDNWTHYERLMTEFERTSCLKLFDDYANGNNKRY